MIIYYLFAIFFLAVIAYVIHGGFKYTRMIGEIFLDLVYQPVVEPVRCTRGEKISILDSSDHEIETIFVRSSGGKKLVIFCHESGSSKESWERYASFLPDYGYHVLSLDFASRKVNTDKNALSQWPLEDDVERLLLAVRWSKKAIDPLVKVTLFGVSNGADIALAASGRDESICGVVADGLFSMKEIFRDYIRKWAPILVKPNIWGQKCPAWIVNTFANLGFWYCQRKTKKHFVDVERLLRKRHVPLLFIYGEQDDYIPAPHQKFLEKITRGRENVGRYVAPKAGHNEAVVVDEGRYEDRVVDFLKAVMR